MVNSSPQFSKYWLEIIALMSKRYVQDQWPSLIPVRIQIFNIVLGIVKVSEGVIRFKNNLVVFGVIQEDLQEVQVHVQIRRTLH
jgi:hypothetical protein